MQQQLQVSLIVQVPDDHVLITKVEYDELQQEKLQGLNWTTTDLEKRIKKDMRWIKKHILHHAKFRRQLDVDFGGFVYYPENRGENWAFNATRMAKFLDDNFHHIFGKSEVTK